MCLGVGGSSLRRVPTPKASGHRVLLAGDTELVQTPREVSLFCGETRCEAGCLCRPSHGSAKWALSPGPVFSPPPAALAPQPLARHMGGR